MKKRQKFKRVKEGKIYTEEETRKKYLRMADLYGCRYEIEAIMDKYYRAMKNCTNEDELRHMSIAGNAELHQAFYCTGQLVVDGNLILPEKRGFEPDGTATKIKK